MSAELDQVTQAVVALNKVEMGLATLRETYGGVVYNVQTTEGMEAARVARRTIREPRFEVERIRKAAKAPILALGKQLDTEAARITRELTLIEAPIDQVIVAEELRKEQEKEARIAAEVARVAQIQSFLDGIREWPINAAGKPSSLVNQMVQTATDYVIDPAIFEERTDEAKGVLIASLAALQGIHQERLNHEAKEAQLELDRKELARLKAEEAQRQKVAAEERAKQEAADKAKRDEEAAAQAEANRVERARIAAEEAEAKKLRDAETAKQNAILAAERQRIADEKAENDRIAEAQRREAAEEAGRLTAARVALEKEQAALAEAQKPKPEPTKAKARVVERLTVAQIIACVAERYQVSTEMAAGWIRHAKVELEKAA